jgi:hypothetical protein
MRVPLLFLFLSLSLALSCVSGSRAFAQMDPTTEMLLSPAVGEEQKAGLQSGRYEVHTNIDAETTRGPADANSRKDISTTTTSTLSAADSEFKVHLKKKKPGKTKKATKQAATALPSKKVSGSEKDINEDPMMGATVVTPSTMPVIPQPTRPPLAPIKAAAAPVTVTTSSTTTTAVTTTTTLPVIVAEPVIPEPVKIEDETPTWKEQIKELVFSAPQEIQEYKEKIHPDDNRMNQIEINLVPGVLAVNSKSNLDYRDYKTTSPAWLIGGEFWLTPFMGIYGSYTSSVGGDVIGNPTNDDHISAQHEWTEIGFDLRKYFGMSRKANSITYGVDYVSYKFKVPSDSADREGLSSNAIDFHIQGRIPVSPTYAWTFGGKIAPRVNISENNTALLLSSGSSPQAVRVGANVGGEFKLSRENQLVWQLSISYEKARYGDSSNLSDPGTGAPIDGVTVDSTTTFFQFGYRWGQ